MTRLTREDAFEAIALGINRAVKDALAGIDLAATIREGIELAFSTNVGEAITKGVYDSFPWPSEISNAISDATFKAMKKG